MNELRRMIYRPNGLFSYFKLCYNIIVSNMIERIEKNEARLDKISTSVKNLSIALDDFKKVSKDLSLLKKYYGSKSWFSDLDAYEQNKLPVKAGVLSEDAVWNTLDDIDDLLKEMKKVVKEYSKK